MISSRVCVVRFFLVLLAMAAFLFSPAPRAALALGNNIEGTAVTEDGQPVNKASITATQTVGGSAAYTVTSGEDGTYTFSNLDCGVATSWKLTAAVTGQTLPLNLAPPLAFKTVSFSGCGSTKSTATPFIFSGRAGIGTIAGRVLISEEPLQVPGFAVTVKVTGAEETFSQDIDGNGNFSIDVATGVYRVSFEENSDLYLAPRSDQQHVGIGETWDMGTMFLEPVNSLAALSGQVRLPNGDGAPSTPVMAVKLEESWPPVTSGSLESALRVRTDENGAFSFNVRGGMWWVGVDFGDPANLYVPEGWSWQAYRTVAPAQVVDDVVLAVGVADAHILGQFKQGDAAGPDAGDACGLAVVTSISQDLSLGYNYRLFSGGAMDVPVMEGEYSLGIIPDPDIDRLLNLIPEPPAPQDKADCAQGKYLTTTMTGLNVTAGNDLPLTIALQAADTTLRVRLLDREGAEVLGVGGQVQGWYDGNWTGASIDPETGTAFLKASQGTWYLTYRVDDSSGYKASPGKVRVVVPADTEEMVVDLPVRPSRAKITGTVLSPDGLPVANAPVSALNLSTPSVDGDKDMTDEAGKYTLWLDYGTYKVMVSQPASIRNDEDEAWISPRLPRAVLSPVDPEKQVDVAFSRGDAVINGTISLADKADKSKKALDDGVFSMPAYIWAISTDGHCRTQAPLQVVEKTGTYSMPVIQGKTWKIEALYLEADALEQAVIPWAAMAEVNVDEAVETLDLPLAPLVDVADESDRVIASFAPELPVLAELPGKLAAYIPASPPKPDKTILNPMMLLNMKLKWWLFLDLYVPEDGYIIRIIVKKEEWEDNNKAADQDIPQDILLVSPLFEIQVQEGEGGVQMELNPPAVLRIPYDPDELISNGGSESNLAAVYYDELMGRWESVPNFVVDTDNKEVVVFAERYGTYALIATPVDRSARLAEAISILQVLSGKPVQVPDPAVSDMDGDGRMGHGEAMYKLQEAAGLR